MMLMKFTQQNCSPCKMVQNFLEANEVTDKVTEVNPFDEPELASAYDIGSVPVTILLDDEGAEVDRVVGFKPDELEKFVDALNETI